MRNSKQDNMRKQSNKKKPATTWETFEEYILTEGLERFKTALEEIDDYTFLKMYPTLLEFIKPKIKRVESTGNSSEPTKIVVEWDKDKSPKYV